MQTERIKRIIGRAVCWALVAACMCAIFYFSSRTATESTVQSSAVLEFFKRIFGESFITKTDLIVRKCAHFLEFTGLGLLFALALFAQLSKPKTALAILFTSLYAITDEVHQIFVEGRACRVYDWAIDTAGAALGAFAFLIFFMIIRKIINKKQNTKKSD